jgi:hypothetical protein
VVLLAGEILKQVKIFVEDGLHPQVTHAPRDGTPRGAPCPLLQTALAQHLGGTDLGG